MTHIIIGAFLFLSGFLCGGAYASALMGRAYEKLEDEDLERGRKVRQRPVKPSHAGSNPAVPAKKRYAFEEAYIDEHGWVDFTRPRKPDIKAHGEESIKRHPKILAELARDD